MVNVFLHNSEVNKEKLYRDKIGKTKRPNERIKSKNIGICFRKISYLISRNIKIQKKQQLPREKKIQKIKVCNLIFILI